MSTINLSPNAQAVLKRRYLRKDNAGKVIETPTELFRRVASFIAEADRLYGADDSKVRNTAERFYSMMSNLDFLPNSPTLMNAGRDLGQLSACFVLPVGDSIDEIFEANKQAAIIHKSGGGTGFSFSRIRPRNSIVRSTSGVASGPVSFMKVINASTEAIKQGGTRRGANMGILRVDHPDILEFVSCKRDTRDVTNFNISVAITDAFMSALASNSTYPLINPGTGKVYTLNGVEQVLDARTVFDLIVDNAWATGEPGLVFLDRMNEGNPTYPYEIIEATNPCGEQPLPPFDSCNLGSINLSNFVKLPLAGSYTIGQFAEHVDWTRLAQIVRLAVHFLDNVIDQNKYPIPQIEVQTKKNRRIGLGVMGWADMLVRLRMPYSSTQAFTLAEKLMSFVLTEGRNHSSELAAWRGKFPNWEHSIYHSESVAMRNATVTTIAPTGTISIIAGCASGIEPHYSLAFERNVMDGTRLVEVNPLFESSLREAGVYNENLLGQVKARRSIQDLAEIPEEIRRIFMTAADVTPEDHIRMQAVFQQFSDSSVSKTINMPESATKEDVRRAYELAYQLNCKGITIYRDNSRPNQVLSTFGGAQSAGSRVSVEEEGPIVAEFTGRPIERPALLKGFTEKIRTGYGNLYVTVNAMDGRPFEVFAQIGKSGYTTMADTEAICRLISLALRSGVDVSRIIKQLRGIGGSAQVFGERGKVTSIPDAIAQVLHRHFGKTDLKGVVAGVALPSEICPECSSVLQSTAGCQTCTACGYSTC